MGIIKGLILIVLFLLISVTIYSADNKTISLYKEDIISYINDADKSINISISSINDNDIINNLIELKDDKNINIKIYLYSINKEIMNYNIAKLSKNNIEFKVGNRSLFSKSFIIKDNSSLINIKYKMLNRVYDNETIDKYVNNFNNLWNKEVDIIKTLEIKLISEFKLDIHNDLFSKEEENKELKYIKF